MIVTCYADGSCDPAARLGTWAVHLRGPDGDVIERSGRCPAYVRGSSAAELAAAYAGVSLARRAWPAATSVRLVTDCLGVMRCLRGLSVARDPAAVYLLGKVRATGLLVDACWTRGHRDPQDDADACLNDRVDRAARYELARWLHSAGLKPHGGQPDPALAPLYEARKAVERAIHEQHTCRAASTASRRWVGYATLLRCFAAARRLSLAECRAVLEAIDTSHVDC